ncbi:HEAT repeat domain-containing protein [bacterium]|nr:HEAT repeat domain-containing protein [candidate division CSSED10-310 bacterium]
MFGNKMNLVEKAIKKNNASTLIGLCNNKDQEVCLSAIAGLGEVGGETAANFMIANLQNTDPKIRTAIAQALGVLGDMHTKAFVSAQMSKEDNPDVRKALGKALGQIKNY